MRQASRPQIVESDKRFVWHPYTPMAQYIAETEPLVVTRAAGSHLFDADGKSYIDANASWWVATLGHGHPRLVAALCDQANTLCHTSLAGVTHAPAALLAEALACRAPSGLTHVFFSDDGSTAIEAAIKMALGYQRKQGRPGRTKFVSLTGAFHGETLGVTALGGVELFRKAYANVLMDVFFAAPPAADAEPSDPAFAALSDLLEEHHEQIAALVMEPILQGAIGMRIYPPSYLEHARKLADRYDILLIADEVFTGYGRTGPFWGVDHAQVIPDIVCAAKGLSGGMLPLAATLACDRVFEAFLGAPEDAFYYGHSYAGNPLGTRIGLEVLSIFDDEDVMGRAQRSALVIESSFRALSDLPGTSDARSIGMVGAIDLGGDGYLGGAGWRAFEFAKKHGVYLRPLGDVVYIAPPLTIEPADLRTLLDVVGAAVLHATEASE